MPLLKMFHNLKLRTKLLLLYTLTILLPLIVVSQVVIYISGDKIINQATVIAKENAKQLSRNIGNLLSNYIDMSDRVCYYDDILKKYLTVSRKYDSVADTIDAYDSYLKMLGFYGMKAGNASAFLKVYFLNTTLIQDSNTLIFANSEIQNSAPYKTALKAEGSIAWGYLESSDRLFASRLFKDDMMQLIGVVSIEIPEDRIYSLLQESDTREKTVIVCDDTGNVVSSNKRSLVGSSIAGKDYFARASVADSNIFSSKDEGNYKAISESLKNGSQFPDWRIITLIPIDSFLADANKTRSTMLLICLSSLVVSGVLSALSLDRITSRIKRVIGKMQKVKEGVFVTMDDTGPNDEIGAMISNFNSMVISLENLIDENYVATLQVKDMALKKREAELYALQSQMNPHFLFNTLESVRMKLSTGGNEAEAASMIFSLSKILRMSLNWQGEIIDLGKEIELTKYYLDINKGRYRDKLDYCISIPEELMKCKIPKLTIQPLVENSIKHGLEKKERFGLISIEAAESDGKLVVNIEDNGAGMSARVLEGIRSELAITGEIKSGGSIGIKNVNDRLVLHYGSEYGLKIQSEEDRGTKVTLLMPVLR